MTVFAAARVVDGTTVHAPGWVSYVGERVTGVGSGRPAHVDQDFGDTIVVPGFVDLHVHGGGGGSFTDGDQSSALKAIETHRRHGTTTTMASLVTASPADLLTSVRQLAELYADGTIAGIHLEGPWISPRHCGAHDPTQLRDPDLAELDRLLSAGRGAIAMVTLAPELPSATEAIRRVIDGGGLAAIGHTDASYDQTVAAIDAGARSATHLFNAMRPIHHRAPGPIVALLEDPRVSIELIGDGTHLHPALYRQVTRTAGEDRVTLVTDAMAAAALGDGRYRLGVLDVDVVDGVARLAVGSSIAGSTATMDVLFRRALGSGTEPESPAEVTDAALLRAVRQTAGNPAATLGRTDIGSLRVGTFADLVVLDPNLRVREVLRRGVTTPTPTPRPTDDP